MKWYHWYHWYHGTIRAADIAVELEPQLYGIPVMETIPVPWYHGTRVHVYHGTRVPLVVYQWYRDVF